ncbi:MAG: hypothetical protein H0X30_32520 [Anaerolineae bacterium]|nr:hypothetical protein [Anaerolineae bacterium]
MNDQDFAQRILGRLQNAELSLLTDAELQAIVDAPLTESDRALALRYSAGRTDVFTELTDNELQRIADGWPPVTC